MKSVAHCSYTTIATWMNDLLGVPVSRGYLSKLCTGVISDSLAEVYDEIKEAIPHQKQLGSDETGFKNNGEKHWVWAICSKDLTLFHTRKPGRRVVLLHHRIFERCGSTGPPVRHGPRRVAGRRYSTSLSGLIFKAFSTPTIFQRTARSRDTTTSGLSFVGHT